MCAALSAGLYDDLPQEATGKSRAREEGLGVVVPLPHPRPLNPPNLPPITLNTQALQLSYKILDWARLLYVARTLVAMTQPAPPDTAPTDTSTPIRTHSHILNPNPNPTPIHPLDGQRAELRGAQVHEAQLAYYCRLQGVGSNPNPNPNLQGVAAGPEGGAGLGVGVGVGLGLGSVATLSDTPTPIPNPNPNPTRICICDNLQPAALLQLLLPRPSPSPNSAFAEAKGIAVEALACLLLALGMPQLCDFTCRLGREGIITATASSSGSGGGGGGGGGGSSGDASQLDDAATDTSAPLTPTTPTQSSGMPRLSANLTLTPPLTLTSGMTRLSAQKGVSALLLCLQVR